MRFLVDENLPLEVASLLQRHGHDALHLSQTEHRGCSDAHLWELAARDERILVTRDLDLPIACRDQAESFCSQSPMYSRSNRSRRLWWISWQVTPSTKSLGHQRSSRRSE